MKFTVARRNFWQQAVFCMALTVFAFSAGAQALIPFGATWKYLDDGSDQGTAWKDSGFIDSGWASGPAVLGFNTDAPPIATTNASGQTTYYYRQAFNVPSIVGMTNLRVALRVDDGAIGYLNGTEIFRHNMPTGAVTYLTGALAAVADDGQGTNYISFATSALQAGNNVIAVEVHQNTNTSSDVVFDLKLEANPLPFVSISSPTNGQTVVGDVVTIRGTAVAGGQRVVLVEGLQGTTTVGGTTNATFTIPWTGVSPGSYTLRTKVTDSSGLVATSAPVNITVQALPASVLISRGSRWKYLDNGSNQGTAWKDPGFNDASWAEGPAELGYGDGDEATIVSYGPNSAAKYATTYFRRAFVVNNPGAYQGLTLETVYDDGAIVYINGTEVHRVRIGAADVIAYDTYIGAGADYATPDVTTISASVLVTGTNIIAVEMHQSDAGSSDISFDLRLEGTVDTTAPYLAFVDPPPGSTRISLTAVNVIFNEPVSGVQASDLLINGEPAASMVVNQPNMDFTFQFPQPPTGVVQIAFADNHGIVDISPLANAFGGTNFTYVLDTNVPTRANLIISEFLASNNNGVRDEDGARNDWIEIFNRGPTDANLLGWYLTDESTNLTKWRFPAKALAQNAYLLVFASGNDRTNPSGPYLHTNFRLSSNPNGFLALVDPQTNIVSVFSAYPQQSADISYGRDRVNTNLVGFYSTPTPGAPNSTSGAGFAAVPTVTPASGVYTQNSVTVTITAPPGTEVYLTLNGTTPTTASARYTGPFIVSANTTLKAAAFPTNNPNLFPSPIVSRSYIFLDDTTRNFTSKVPIIIISTEGRAITAAATPRTKGSVVVLDTFRGTAALTGPADYIGNAEFEIFGQTSAGFPKQPHNIELQDENGNDANVGLLGFPPDGDWKLRNPYSDKCLMNDFLAFELFEQMGNYSVRRKLVEVFRDTGGGKVTYPGDYYGVMCFSEKIEQDKNRVDIEKLTSVNTNEPSISGGYMFKKDKENVDGAIDVNFTINGGDSHPTQALKLHEPKPVEVNYNANHPQVVWLRNYLNRMAAALYDVNWKTLTGTNHYSNYLDIDAFVDGHWIVEFPKQIDGYRLSDYFTKDRNGKVKMAPIWDWNLSFGNADYLDGGNTNTWYFDLLSATDHIWLRRLIHGGTGTSGVGDIDFCQKVADRWSVLRTNVMNGPRVTNRIDEIAGVLSTLTYSNTSAADRDFAKFPRLGTYIWPNPNGGSWAVNYVTPTTYGGIISEMKKWVNGRYLWIDSQFAKRPEFNSPGGAVSPGFSLVISAPPGHTIYYTLDGTDPRAAGGGILSGALVYSGPITVTTNIRVFARTQAAGSWQGTWGGPNAITLYTSVPNLRITEVMYHPHDPPPGIYLDEDFEYVEVKNIGGIL